MSAATASKFLLMPCIDNVGVASDVGTVSLLAVTTFMVKGRRDVVRREAVRARHQGPPT